MNKCCGHRTLLFRLVGFCLTFYSFSIFYDNKKFGSKAAGEGVKRAFIVLVLHGIPEIGAHVSSNFGYLICFD